MSILVHKLRTKLEANKLLAVIQLLSNKGLIINEQETARHVHYVKKWSCSYE